MESGDAFFVSPFSDTGYQLVVLQSTVGASHPVKVNGLHDISLAFPQDVRDRITRRMLVFLTPLHGRINSVQTLINQKGDPMHSNDIPIVVEGLFSISAGIKTFP